MRVIAINRSDGLVSIMRIIDDTLVIQDEINKWEETMLGITAISYQEVSESDIPTDWTNRNAWTWQ